VKPDCRGKDADQQTCKANRPDRGKSAAQKNRPMLHVRSLGRVNIKEDNGYRKRTLSLSINVAGFPAKPITKVIDSA
jgi:hypothetical protein